jgi:hypothetical protein
MSVWLLARRFDISRWKYAGKSKGQGIGKFTLTAASVILRRTPGHIRKLLRAAKRSGLIRLTSKKATGLQFITQASKERSRLQG